jgi:methylglutamate dehydrogenase subunit B
MRINCPLCGDRDSREFHYRGSAKLLNRPDGEAGEAAFHDYVYLRENTAGVNDDLWFHKNGCRSWLVVARNVTTHEIASVKLACDVKRGGK